MKYFINYATNGFFESQKIGLYTAEQLGFNVKGYTDVDINNDFKIKNGKIFNNSRGAGYWIWKPYIILDMLNNIKDGDFLIYMDSGANLLSDPSEYLEMIDEKGILAFSMVQKTSKWTKGDCFYKIDSELKFKDVNQLQGTYIFFKKCENSVKFVNEWLELCCEYDLISDSPNNNMDNLYDFIDHRHDQSIFSLLAYKNNIKNVPQIDQYCIEHPGINISRKIIDRHGLRK